METKNKICALSLKDIVKIYGQAGNEVKALRGININFRKSEFVSILGPSGCGKTTMLNIIGGLDRYTCGDLIIDGKSTKKYSDSDWDTYRNNSIGFVFQSYNLIPHQTIEKNVELALTLSGVSKTERKRRATDVLEKVGLKGLGYKLPNQLSGGQMQRVAIARALVNNPEIILADEPTGALDTETSIQIMEMLKEVSKDRLVIMVTHNPELAEKYSTRIIKLLDGEKIDDSMPLELGKENNFKNNKNKKVKSHMNFSTAFALSLSNLRSKKGRTILTSIAGSIGIIGIALVLAVSTGFGAYINKLQGDTLSVYPVTISEATIDLSDFNKLADKTVTDEMLNQKVKDNVYTRAMFGDLTNMLKNNKLSDEYVEYINSYVNSQNSEAEINNKGWSYCLQKGYGFDMNNYIFTNIGVNMKQEGSATKSVMAVDNLVRMLERMFNEGIKQSNMNISAEFVRSYIPTLSEIPENQKLIESQYDKLYGDWATSENDLLLVVDSYNRVTDITLALLGFRTIEKCNTSTYEIEFGGDSEFSFEDALNKKFYFIPNDSRYNYLTSDDNKFIEYTYNEDSIPAQATVLNIKGIVRLKENVQQGVLDTGIAYTSQLVNKVLTTNKNSDIVTKTNAITSGTGKSANIYTSMANRETLASMVAQTLQISVENVTDDAIYQMISSVSSPSIATLRSICGVDSINKISLYSVDFQAKEDLKKYLDSWNEKEGRVEEDKVHYSDSTAMMFSALNSTVDGVKIVLVCFTSISLVVSSIMIGIITYVSVVERTKEIGVLRSLGARKKDISRIFNAETFLIGLFAGLIGVIFTYLISIPINLIISGMLANVGNVASLKIVDAVILVAVSFVLTLIAGIIPARVAAKKDPVVALRSE